MEPHDHNWPSSCDTWILLVQFLLSWHFSILCSKAYEIILVEGKCHLQPKLFTLVFEKKWEKEFNLEFDVGIGQIKSGKWTGGRGAENSVVLFYVVALLFRSGEHSAETLHIYIYKCNEAMTKLQRLYLIYLMSAMKQWSRERVAYKYLGVQWSNNSVAETLHNFNAMKQDEMAAGLYIL